MEKAGEIFLTFLQRNGMVAIVILAVLFARLLLRKCPRKYSYWLWAVVGIRMVFDLPFASRFSLFNLFRLSGKSTGTAGTAAAYTGSPAAADNLITAVPNPLSADEAGTVSAAVIPEISAMQAASAILFFVWIAGMVLMMAYGVYSYVKCRKLVRTAVILKKPLRMHGEKKEWHMNGVWECDRIPSPFVLGIFRPQIYIPFHMEEQGQQYILAHECCHIRRHDPLWKPLAFILLAVYWWNPLAWVAFFCMVRDMEMSCDEAVIESFGAGIKKGYSESLLEFAMERHPYSFAPVAFGEGDAGKRIKNVLNFKKPHAWVAAVVTVLTVVVAVSCLTNQKPRVENNVPEQQDTQEAESQDSSEADEKTEQGVREWAQAFASRDADTILKLATEDAKRNLKDQDLLMGEGFGWSSPWPWGEENANIPYTINMQVQTAEIWYYAMVSDPHVTVWKETIHYAFEDNEFRVTQEELKVYDAISSGDEFGDAYPHGIKGTAMDYRTNEMMETLNGHITDFPDRDDPLLHPAQAARFLLNLSEDENKVQVTEDDTRAEDGSVFVQIAFPGDGTVLQVKMIQPYGRDGIWIPEDVQAG